MVGAVRSFKYYVDVKGERKGASPALLPELKTAGVTVVDTASNAREASAAKMLISACLRPLVFIECVLTRHGQLIHSSMRWTIPLRVLCFWSQPILTYAMGFLF